MKRLGFAVLMSAIVAFGVAACDDDNPTDPSSSAGDLHSDFASVERSAGDHER